MIDLVMIYGSSGLLMLLIAFVLNLLGKLKHDSYIYNILNGVGGLVLSHYAFLINAIVFTILEGVWGLFGIYGLAKLFFKSRKKK